MPKIKNFQRTRSRRQAAVALACSVVVLLQSPVARAANQTWDGGGANAFWSNIANWVGDSAAPGDTVSTNNSDVAAFNAGIANNWGTSNNPIVIDLNRNIGGINFDGASGYYYIGSQTGNALKVSSGGSIQILSTVTAQTFITINAPLSIQGANGTYTLANNSGFPNLSTIRFGGSISGGAAGATTLTLAGSNSNENIISGSIGNGAATSLGVTKNGTGMWQLEGTNTYSGATTINQGVLKVNSNAALGNGSATNTLILNGGTLMASGNFTSSATRGISLQAASTVDTDYQSVALAGTITGAGSLTKTGLGTLSLTGAYDYTGSTFLNMGALAVSGLGSGTNFVFRGGTLRYTGGNAAWNRSYTINAGATAFIDVSDRAANLTLNATSGATTGSFTKRGFGTLTLAAAQAYTGLTTLSGGTLALDLGAGGSNIVSSSSALYTTGGTLRLTGAGSQTFNGLEVSAFSTTRFALGDSQTLSLGSLTGLGSGRTVNFNTSAGGANANSATVGTSQIVLTGQTTGSVIHPSWTVQDNGGFGLATVNASNRVVRLTTTPLLPASGASASSNYRIDNNGGTSATAGSYQLAIAASQSALGITVDTTNLSGSATLASGVALSVDTWNFGGNGANTWQISGSAGGAGIRPITSGNNVQINNWNTGKVTFNAPILSSASSVLILGTGTTVLAGANAHTGPTYVWGGTLEVPTGGVIPSGLVVGDQAGNEGTFNLTGGSVTGMRADLGYANGAVGTANVSAGSWVSDSVLYAGYHGSGTLNISGGSVSSYQSMVGFAYEATGAINITGGTWATTGGYSSIGENGFGTLNLSGTGAINNNSTMYLGNGSTATGIATMTGGTWTIASGGLTVGYAGTGLLNLSGGAMNTTGNVQVGSQSTGSGTVNVTGGTWTIGSTNTVSVGSTSVFNLSGTGSISSGSVSFNGVGTVSGGTWTINGTSQTFTSLTIYNSGSRAFNLTDSGVINLSVNGVEGTGTVNLGFSSGSTGTINIGTGGVAGTIKAAVVTAFMGAGVVNFNHTNNITFTPSIVGNVSVIKQGSGTTTLAGNNTHVAATTVTAGTLLVSGVISGSPIAVNSSGTLGGTGTIANVVVNSGASLQGGDGGSASGSLKSGGIVSLLDGSTIKLTLGTGGAHSSLARTGGLWSFDSDQSFTMNFAAPAETGFYNNIITGLAGNESGLSTVSTWKLTNPGIVGTFTYDNAGGVDLTITAIPEPGTASLLALISLGLLGSRRWRRRAASVAA